MAKKIVGGYAWETDKAAGIILLDPDAIEIGRIVAVAKEGDIVNLCYYMDPDRNLTECGEEKSIQTAKRVVQGRAFVARIRAYQAIRDYSLIHVDHVQRALKDLAKALGDIEKLPKAKREALDVAVASCNEARETLIGRPVQRPLAFDHDLEERAEAIVSGIDPVEPFHAVISLAKTFEAIPEPDERGHLFDVIVDAVCDRYRGADRGKVEIGTVNDAMPNVVVVEFEGKVPATPTDTELRELVREAITRWKKDPDAAQKAAHARSKARKNAKKPGDEIEGTPVESKARQMDLTAPAGQEDKVAKTAEIVKRLDKVIAAGDVAKVKQAIKALRDGGNASAADAVEMYAKDKGLDLGE